MKKQGTLVVVSGFAGTGKGTVMKELLGRYDSYALSISATTRNPRPGEVDGREYFFKTTEEFKRMIEEEEFVEYACYVGNYYGTPKKYVQEQLEAGKDVILEIEIQGALNIKSQFPDALLLFIAPPSADVLKSRLVGRGTETEDVIEQRLARAVEESKGIENYDYLVVNDDLDECVETVHQMIGKIQEAGIQNIMALRGDIPAELEGADRSHWHYHNAIDLVRELKESGNDFCIGGACYPEIHPESPHQKEDIKYLKEKVDAGCDFLTTQMFFDNNLLYNFLYKIREAGITVPIIPGIMPITNANQIERALKLSGSYVPQRFKTLVDKFGSDPDAMKQAGIAYATDQIIDLYANGITNVHVYSMNKPDVAQKIQSNLSAILGKK